MYVESVVLRRKRKPSIIQTQLTRTQYIISYTSLPGNIFWEVQVGFGKQEALEACQPLLALAFSALCNPTCEPSLMQRRCEPSIGLLQAAYIRSLVVRGLCSFVLSKSRRLLPAFSARVHLPISSLIQRKTVDFHRSVNITSSGWPP